LLDPLVRAKFDTDPIMVSFKTEYDGGRWSGRTAKTLKSWFITETLRPGEVALTWTDNRAAVRSANVHVQFLEPARPILNQRVLIIEGTNIGEIGILEKRKRGGKSTIKLVVVKLDHSNVHIEIPETALCRISDQE
jgi:hypothetical protein